MPPDPDTSYYFAYGSNMSQAQMKTRCPSAVFVSTALLRGHKLDFTLHSMTRKGGVADVVPDDHRHVWGLLYRMTPADLHSLDGYECPAYDRRMITVLREGVDPVTAWIYVVKVKQSFQPPSEGYLKLLVDAAEEHEFPQEYRRFLRGFAVARQADA